MFTWGASSYFGWGVYGLNLALNWAGDPDLELVCAVGAAGADMVVDPVAMNLLRPFLAASEQLTSSLRPYAGGVAQSSGPVLHQMNGSFVPVPAAHDVTLNGRPDIGVTFFETAHLGPDAVSRARALPAVIAGSSWNAQVLRAAGVENVTTILQGIDPALFHPAPRRGLIGDRFLVFSGGKLERRKGQDLVVAAFRIFAERHPEALLVTAWNNPWPQLARSVDSSGLVAPVVYGEDGRPDVPAWLAACGLRPDQVLDLGEVANLAMPTTLREMDVALFPNRCEGGTNLVAMEAMACGVPVILSRNSGHLDLIAEDNCYPLDRQGGLPGGEAGFGGVAGWGESEVDEIVAALEAVHADREAAARRGLKGAEQLASWTWRRTAQHLKETVLALC